MLSCPLLSSRRGQRRLLVCWPLLVCLE